MRAIGLVPALPMIAGAAVGIGCSIEPQWYLVALLGAGTVALAAFWRRHGPACVVALVVAFAAAGGALGASTRADAVDSPLRVMLEQAIGGVSIASIGPEGDHDPIEVRGRLTEDAAIFEGFASLQVEVAALRLAGVWQPTTGRLRVSVSGNALLERSPEWRAGRVIEAPVTFRRPARYLNAGVADFERDLALGGTSLLGSVKSGLLVDVVAPGHMFAEWAGRARARVRAAVHRYVSPHDPLSGALVTAILIGDRAGLPIEVRDRLQRAGTYHVVAISGGNIAILAGLGMLALAACGVRGRVAALATAVGVVVYAGVVTAGPSVWRATTMTVIYLAARAGEHRTPPWQAMALTAALMVTVAPLDVRDAGFVLTFGATASLLEAARRAGVSDQGRSRPPVGVRRRLLSWVALSLTASVAVEAVLLPVSAQLFSLVTVAGLALNVAAVPLMGVVQIAGMVVTAAAGIEAVASPAGWVAHVAAASLVDSARLLDVTPWLSRRVPPPGPWILAAYYGALALVPFGGPRRLWRGAAALVLGASLALIVTGWRPSLRARHPELLTLTVLDVGQAEAMLLELPAGPTLLIDAAGVPFGQTLDIGARVIAPALWARGLRRLDGLLITHGDPDHLGGAVVVNEVFAPEWLWEGVMVPSHLPTTLLREQVASGGGRIEALRAGREHVFGEARLRVLHPPEPDWERPRVRNDDSVVLEVRYRDVAILLTGDIGAEVERAILPQLTPARLRILKVAHHGSRTSSAAELIETWRPQLALISAGRGNSFGHPTAEVLRRLESVGATILRTDRHGQITVETDGRTVNPTSFVEQRR